MAALDTSLDEYDEVVQFAQRSSLPPSFNLAKRHIMEAGLALLEVLVVSHKKESLCSEVDDVTLTAKSVRLRIVLDVESTKET